MKDAQPQTVRVIGAGLAGSECALQLAKRGISVVLHEQRPATTTPAHKTGECAELVCSNSLKSEKPSTAAGTLKQELDIMGSELLPLARKTRVPAGNALAVNRELFSKAVTEKILSTPNITLERGEVSSLGELLEPRNYVIVATGPLTSPKLLEELQRQVHNEGANLLHFYDAAAPIVETASLNFDHLFAQSRYEFQESERARAQTQEAPHAMASVQVEEARGARTSAQPQEDKDGPQSLPVLDSLFHNSQPFDHFTTQNDISNVGDYLNCPLTPDQYAALVDELCMAETVIKKDFERTELFQACQPVEEIARTGKDSLRFGPLKPVGLVDPKTGKRPYAALQLRAENAAKTAYNLVGFQTNLTFSEQKRIFSHIPGLENAAFMRFGVMHKNSFFDAPRLFDRTFALRDNPYLRFAGQIAGTEGYVEAIASGLYAALNTFADIQGLDAPSLPVTSLWGSLVEYATNPETKSYQPMHVNFGLLPPLEPPIKNKRMRYEAYASRALKSVEDTVRSRSDIFVSSNIKSSVNF